MEETISAADFKARCLELLDRVARTREEIVVTKRGRPVARLVPLADVPIAMEGSVRYGGDIVEPTGEEWDADAPPTPPKPARKRRRP